MADYAVAHAPKGTTVVVTDSATIVLLTNDQEKDEFVAGLGPTDRIFTQMGGVADRFVLACLRRKALVFRIPLNRLSADAQVLAKGATQKEEEEENGNADSHVKNEGSALTKRRLLALVFWKAKDDQYNAFYPSREMDAQHLRLASIVKAWSGAQKRRIAAHLQMLQEGRDLYLVRDRDEQTLEEFLIAMFRENIESFRSISPDRLEAYLLDLAKGNPSEEGVELREEALAKRIKKELQDMVVYREVFRHIHGMGPSIAGRIIATIGDIRRFASPWALRAYAGYHHFADGSRARRVRGKAFNVTPLLRQGVWLWTQQIGKSQLGSNIERELLDRRKGYEIVKLLREKNLLPPSFTERLVEKYSDLTLVDVFALLGWIDGLRGEKREKENPENEKEADGVQERYKKQLRGMAVDGVTIYNAALAAYDAGLACATPTTKKQLQGIKGYALKKSYRWLGQRLIERLYHDLTNLVTEKVSA